jgi:hypothetical protein
MREKAQESARRQRTSHITFLLYVSARTVSLVAPAILFFVAPVIWSPELRLDRKFLSP